MDGRTAAAVLGIAQGATRDEIRRAFRARAKIAHPDAHGTDEAFVTLRAAADLLLALAPDRPGRRADTPGVDGSAPLHCAATGPTVTTGTAGTAGPATTRPPAGAAGRRAGYWDQGPVRRPGAAIDLTDRPAGIRHQPGPAAAPAAATAFARVLEAELARH
ncbi:MAG: DnaJ domain-containing protein [Acidimicrobiales bacterium]